MLRHTVPLPRYRFGAAHADAATTEHEPVAVLQHAPGHGFGRHVRPAL